MGHQMCMHDKDWTWMGYTDGTWNGPDSGWAIRMGHGMDRTVDGLYGWDMEWTGQWMSYTDGT